MKEELVWKKLLWVERSGDCYCTLQSELKICMRFWERWNYCKKKSDWALSLLLWDRIDRELKSEGNCLWRAFVFLEGSLQLWNSCLPLCLNTGSLCLIICLLFVTVKLIWGFTYLPEQDCRFQCLLPFQMRAQRQNNVWSFENMFSFTWKLL